MKLKYYLRGLGIGIFATVIILTIASFGKNKELTDEEIIERAEELGMVMPEKSGSILDHLNGASPEEGQSPNQEDASSGHGGGSNGLQDDTQQREEGQPQDETDPAANPDTDPEEEDPESDPVTALPQEGSQQASYVSIHVGEGEFSDRISSKLKEAGLIEDAEEFNRFLTDSGIDDRISIGSYRIPQGATYQEIADILRGAPNGTAQ